MKSVAFEMQCDPGKPAVVPAEVTSQLPAGEFRVILVVEDAGGTADEWGAFSLRAMWAEEDPRDAEYDRYLSG